VSRIEIDERPPTRAQRRRRARAERLALQEEQATRALRRRRLTLLAGVLCVVVAGAAVVLIASGQSATKRIAPQSAQARALEAQVGSLLEGVPQHGNVLGQSAAPVTLQYFADLECPVCRSFTASALPSLIQRWVRGGQLKIEYRSVETATREPEVFADQQVAALAAGLQDRMWNFVETFYGEQQEEGSGYVTESYLQGIARQVPGLDLRRWASERSDPALSAAVLADAQAANADVLNGTPAFLVGRSGQRLRRLEPSSFTEAKPFDEAIKPLLSA
jgi:protein-disulfide isomerase